MKAKVLARSITTEPTNGIDHAGNPVIGGRHWHRDSIVELSDVEFAYFAKQKVGNRIGDDFTGPIVEGPCVEKVVERGTPVAAAAPADAEDDAPATPPQPKKSGGK